jgi:hypothetical protein
MKKLIAALTVTLAAVIAACVPTPPVPPPVNYLFKEIFWSSAADPNATPPRPEPHSCAISPGLGDASLHGPYKTVDTFWNANGWAFWVACVVPARDSGRALPVVKDNPACTNERTLVVIKFHLDTAPVFGQGSGHYDSFNGSSFAAWCKLYVEATG